MTNRATSLLAVFVLMAAASPFLVRARPADPAQDSPVEIRAESMEISDISSEASEISVLLAATAKQTATLRSISFDQVTVDGVRVQVEHVEGPIQLRSGEPVTSLPRLRATVNYRELESLEPLRRIVSNGRARVKATLRGELQLSLFQKLMLLAGGAWVITEMDESVPVSLPGGTLGRMSAVAALWAAEPLWIAGHSASEWRRNRSEVADTARSSAASRLVSLETRYQLRARNGEIAAMRHTSAGFLVGKRQVLAPAEAVEPWLFNSSIAEALENGEIRVEQETFDILAAPAGEASRTFSLKNKDVRVVKMLSDGEKAISVVTKRPYRVRFRNSDANAALLELKGWEDTEKDPRAFAEPDTQDWLPAAVMRLYHPGRHGSLWLTEVRLEKGRYQLRHPADSAAFGSPVWVGSGIVGLLQDERSAGVANRLVKKLR